MTSLRMEPGWDNRIFRDTEMRNTVARTTARVAELAIAEAPATKKPNWNKIKKNITADVAVDAAGWYGNVVIEDDKRVRHAMLQNEGWTDRKSRRHPGRFYLKRALMKARQQ